MRGQLVLIPTTSADWRLDERTRETGRKGVAAAREILRRARAEAAPGPDAGTDNDAEATAYGAAESASGADATTSPAAAKPAA